LSRERRHAFPGFSRLYEVIPDCDRYFRGSLNSPDTLRVTRGEVPAGRGLTLSYKMHRSVPGLVVFPLSPFGFCLRQTVVDMLESRQVTGWSTYPVLVIDKAGREYPDFAGIVVNGRCGAVSNRKSPSLEKGGLLGPRTATWWRGMYFKSSTWDGSDLFMPDANQGHMLCSERAHAAFKDAGVKELEFTPMDQVELPFQIRKPERSTGR
jgi:hypothetical protein